MKILAALKIDNITIPPPSSIQHLSGGIGAGENILRTGLTVFTIIMVILAVFVILYSGIQWITSQGDKQKVQGARSRLTYAIIGLIIILLSFFIVTFIGNVFGVDLFKIR